MPQEGRAADVEHAHVLSSCAKAGAQLDTGMKDRAPGVILQRITTLQPFAS